MSDGDRGTPTQRANWAETRSPGMGSRRMTSVHNNHNMDDMRRQRLASLKQLLELLQSAPGHQHGIRVETSVKIKTKQKKPPQQTVIDQVTLSLLSIGGKGKSSKITATP